MKRIVGIIAIVVGGLTMAFNYSSPEEKVVVNTVKQEDEGIKFQNLTYEDALKLSKRTGKPIFIDCYTSWCGPCKVMARKTFTDKEVGEYFNKNFINLKVEMEKDADGPELARLFKVRAYPTLLFVDGNGDLIKQSLGMIGPNVLMDLAKSVVNN
ncbi:MAG TPA: thioredoxin family protein [Taishania sp.]|nr:thioredoxin family protein [Taishania sp.]